jgi:hypothetical protein
MQKDGNSSTYANEATALPIYSDNINSTPLQLSHKNS